MLKHYIFKLNSGWLVGAEHASAPCSECVSLWLRDRNVAHERTETLPARKDVLDTVQDVNHPAVLFEIDSETGSINRLECRIERHPECNCSASGFTEYPGKKINYAFSSITQLKCTRFGTSSGNVWLASAVHRDGRTAKAVGTEREAARRAVVAKLDQTQATKLEQLRYEILAKYSAKCKQPMIVVGSSSWLHNALPHYLLQQFDIHLLFYPNAEAAWVFGAVAISRINDKAVPVWSYGAHQNAEQTIKDAALGLIALIGAYNTEQPEQHPKLTVWLTHWIYRCPKVSLRDMLALEAYPAEALDAYKPAPISTPIKSVLRLVLGGGEGSTERRADLKLVS